MKNQMKNQEWMFNFIDGGWNTVYAKTKKGAIAAAKKQYAEKIEQGLLIPNEKTFCLVNENRDQYRHNMMLYY
jgi:hypothetical protein